MREQVITPRGNGRGALASGRGRSGGVTQKPARRGASSRAEGSILRTVLRYLPFVGKILLAVITGVLIFAGYRAAASASFFAARNIDISGTSLASAQDIEATVRNATKQTGVWRANLEAIKAEVEKLPWVRSAVVSRVLPDGLRVRVTERTPRAVVRTSAGRFIWVDEDAVILDRMSPTDQMPEFFIRGWDEALTNEARRENQERIRAYLSMLREWKELGLSERVSEVNLGDLRDVRAQLSGADSRIEVRLGSENYGKRLKQALDVLDRARNTTQGPLIVYLDASSGKNIAVGHSLNPLSVNNEAERESDNPSPARVDDEATVNPVKPTRQTAKDKPARKENEARQRKGDKKEASADKTKEGTRPRRVR